MHLSALRLLPWALMGHCIFSMWAYGSPEIWPDGFHVKGTNSSGNTTYEPNDRNFGERLFNKNSIIFFIFFILFLLGYIFENIILTYIYKFVFKKISTIDVAQPSFKDCKKLMDEWTITSYQPSKNLKYDKLLKAMLDVAEVNADLEDSGSKEKVEEQKEEKKKPGLDSQNGLLEEEKSGDLPDIHKVSSNNNDVSYSEDNKSGNHWLTKDQEN